MEKNTRNEAYRSIRISMEAMENTLRNGLVKEEKKQKLCKILKVIMAITLATAMPLSVLFRDDIENFFPVFKNPIDTSDIIFHVVIPIFAIFLTITVFFRLKENSDFSDIDKHYTSYKSIIEAINKLKYSTEKNQTKPPTDELNKYNSFHLYFSSIIESLNEQIEIADKKASLLLDKGTSYSRNGIYLYVFIIIAWQVITWITDLQTRHIYGIASCSLLFIFIEFLSAWFLKQYRHFVDTSTYLIKLRSTLERYILTYLALKEVKANGGNFDPLIDLLKSEIKWPEMAQKGMQDVSAPKELIDSLSNLCLAFKKSN